MSAAEELAVGPFTFPCPDAACPGHKSRPYSRDKQYPSVTTLIGLLDKPGLSWGAANETAKFAIHHQADWRGLDDDAAYDRLRKHHRVLWDGAARMGTVAHAAADAFANGERFACPDDMDPVERQQAETYIAGLLDWWSTRDPEVLAAELIVRHTSDRCRYIGSLDMLALVDGAPTVLDWKCTKKLDGDGYVQDWTLQTHAYALTTELCHYHGTKLVSTMTWAEAGLPQPAQGMIVNIMGDGSWREFRCDIDPAVLDTIEALWRVKQFKPHMALASVGNQPELVVYEPRPDAPVDVEAWL